MDFESILKEQDFKAAAKHRALNTKVRNREEKDRADELEYVVPWNDNCVFLKVITSETTRFYPGVKSIPISEIPVQQTARNTL